jgi:hypothetical protein
MSKIRTAALMMAVTIAWFGVALAQGDTGYEEEDAPPVQLSPDEQIEQARKIVKMGENLSNRVNEMLADARKETDIIRITCLNEKLKEINANLRNAQKRLEALEEAPNEDARNHEFTVLTVLGEKFKTLAQEANQCVGEDIFEIGATRVETDIDPSQVPDEDASQLPDSVPDPLVPQIPPPASGIN